MATRVHPGLVLENPVYTRGVRTVLDASFHAHTAHVPIFPARVARSHHALRPTTVQFRCQCIYLHVTPYIPSTYELHSNKHATNTMV